MQISVINFNDLKIDDTITFFYRGGTRRGIRVVKVTELNAGDAWTFRALDYTTLDTDGKPTVQRFSWRYIADARVNGWGEPHVLKMEVPSEQKPTKTKATKAKSGETKEPTKPKTARPRKVATTKEL